MRIKVSPLRFIWILFYFIFRKKKHSLQLNINQNSLCRRRRHHHHQHRRRVVGNAFLFPFYPAPRDSIRFDLIFIWFVISQTPYCELLFNRLFFCYILLKLQLICLASAKNLENQNLPETYEKRNGHNFFLMIVISNLDVENGRT